jgi:hypothetical protein
MCLWGGAGGSLIMKYNAKEFDESMKRSRLAAVPFLSLIATFVSCRKPSPAFFSSLPSSFSSFTPFRHHRTKSVLETSHTRKPRAQITEAQH